ncbi:MAG TPA: CHAT domain-containing protein [Thermoanaerobaculia bacterium]|jgi:CHAT domain-containing protein|nr:CHAT domain-containing protein [Thermoanaerobaculia bacterium]
MNDVRPRHPEAQIMAAFVEGTLTPDEIAAVAGHLKGCGDCRTVVSETARFGREEDAREAPARTHRWWLLAVAAVLAAIVITVPLVRYMGTRDTSPIARLIEATPRQHRFVEARLSGFPWAQLQAPPRGEAIPDPADLKLTGAAGEVLEKTAGQHQSESRHATGVAYLLINRRNDGIAALEQAANGSSDPRAWNDLAAARYAVATQDEHPSQLPLALADADHALRLDPKSPEALFNRALILEHLGVRDQARKAWQAYLAVDGGSAWGVEARAHLRALETVSRRFDPRMLETVPADQLVRDFPQEARTWGEGPMLASWADAEAAKDPSAPAKLARVHAIGDALEAFNGERLLSDAVAAIERSSSTGRAAIVEGHHLYAEGRLALSRHSAGGSEATLIRSTALFREGGSPMAYMASYYTAVAESDEHRGNESQQALIQLAATIDANRCRALAAQIKGSQAVLANASGYWGSGVRVADSAAAAFRSLGEVKNAAYIDFVAAHAFDMIGAGDPAWSRRIHSCGALTELQDRERLCTILRSSATTLESFGHIEAAASMTDLAIDESRFLPTELARALTDRARLADRAGDRKAAGIALTSAHRATAAITDRMLRETLDASIDVAQASIRSRTQPYEAIATLDRVIAFFTEARLGYLLPDAYLQRARAFRSAGNETAAIADYGSARREVDVQRNTIGGDDLRLRFLDTAAQIIEESIEIHLSRGSVAEALAVADRTRELQMSLSASLPERKPHVASGTAVIEYIVLPHAIDIFCVSAGQTTVQNVAAERGDVAERVASFGESIRRREPLDQIRPLAAALYKLLITPVEPRLSGIDELVVVPDRQLYSVPFAALYDEQSGAYLTERFTIRLAPAASAVLPEMVDGALKPALIVADPSTPRWPRLPASLQEGDRIAAAYGAITLSGEGATRARFVAAATGSSLIHYAGHADSDMGDYGALILAPGNGDPGVLAASDIAQLVLVRHPLVVLAACGTFRGDSVHVGGMSSLARAFLVAGARAVAGTLWEVDDDVAAPLFLRLHEHLRAGESPARAVRAAQLEMLHASDPRVRHPATWAPIELLGNS